MTIAITTSLRESSQLVQKAHAIAQKLQADCIPRHKQSVNKLLQSYEALIIVSNKKLTLVSQEGRELTFHPDTAMLRVKNQHDALLELLGFRPLQVLDTTMGLASDAVVMSFAGHEVTALESSPLIHLIVSQGLSTYLSGNAALDKAMRAIKTKKTDSLTYLKSLVGKSVDVVYCDPMFSEQISESQNLAGLESFADYSRLDSVFLNEAKRIARKKIIIKAHFRDSVFEDLGFKRLVRPNQKFHYGVIELEG